MKKIYSYAIVMIIFVFAIVLTVFLSETKIDNNQKKYEELLAIEKTESEKLKDRIVELEKENEELKRRKEQTITTQSDFEQHIQSMNDLTEIYKLIERKKLDEAKELFSRLETAGFDDSTLAYYELLKDVLEK